jgi:N-acetylneuraminic acid mutarotase
MRIVCDRMKFLFPILMVFVMVLSCDDTKEVVVAVVKTESVTVTRTRTIFQGSISNSNGLTIIEHGFVWDQHQSPSLETSLKFLLGPIAGDKSFIAEVDANFEPGRKYYVRSFYQSHDQIFYSEAVSFEVNYEKAPVVLSFSPTIATWGDTITISGSNFSLVPSDNHIAFSDIEALCVEATSKELKTIIPDALNMTNLPLAVTVFNHQATSAEFFKLAPPKVASFAPSSGRVKTSVTLSGENFKEGSTTVYFNDAKATIISISSKQVIVEVPPGLPPGHVKVLVDVCAQKVFASEPFLSVSLTVAEFMPTSATFDEIVTVKGSGFSTIASENKIAFGDVEAMVMEATADELKIKVPRALQKSKSKISIHNDLEAAKSSIDFSLLSPVISDFSPKSCPFGNTIVIVGQYFNPTPEHNKIVIGSAPATVLESSADRLKVIVPDQYQSATGKSRIMLTIADIKIESAEEFELPMHSIVSFTPLSGARGNVLTITGNNFNPSAVLNKVFIGSVQAEVQTSSTTNTLSAAIPSAIGRGNYAVRVVTGGREAVASQSFSCDDAWAIKAPIGGGPRRNGFAFAIGNKGYVGGGFDQNGYYKNDIYEYDPITNTWTRKNVIPVNGEGMVTFATSAKGYIVFQRELWQYDPEKNTWTRKADFPGLSIRGQSAFAIGDIGYVGTGLNSWGSPSAEFFEYSEQQNSWAIRTPLPMQMRFGTGFSVGNKGYFATGSWTQRNVLEFEPGNTQWVVKLNLLDIVAGMNEMRVYAVGISGTTKGYISTGSTNDNWGTAFNDLYEYDPVANKCTRLPDLPGPARQHAIGFSINDKVYVGGGSGLNEFGGYTAQGDFYEYTPEN